MQGTQELMNTREPALKCVLSIIGIQLAAKHILAYLVTLKNGG